MFQNTTPLTVESALDAINRVPALLVNEPAWGDAAMIYGGAVFGTYVLYSFFLFLARKL